VSDGAVEGEAELAKEGSCGAQALVDLIVGAARGVEACTQS